MTPSIGLANQLAQAIALHLARAGTSTGTAAGSSVAGAARRSAVSGGAGKDSKATAGRRDLDSLIALRIGAIDRDDPQRGRKAFQVFVEAVLLSRCGERMINNPSFHQLVDAVHGALEADPGTKQLVDRAVAQLLKEPGKP
jgi:hypothetical protein